MGRAVRVNAQLKSHKRFASAFPGYCQLVDNARLYCTNALGGPPTVKAKYLFILILSFQSTSSTAQIRRENHVCSKKKKKSEDRLGYLNQRVDI